MFMHTVPLKHCHKILEKEKYALHTIIRLMIFRLPFCHRHVEKFLKGPGNLLTAMLRVTMLCNLLSTQVSCHQKENKEI